MDQDLSIAIAKYDYTAEAENELSIRKNDKLTILDDSQLWWRVQNENSLTGYVPSNYLSRKDSVKGKKNIIDNIKSKVLKKSSDNNNDQLQNDVQAPKLSKTSNNIVMFGTVKYRYVPLRDDEIELNRGEQVNVYEMENDGWCKGECNGKVGWFPFNYIQKSEDTPVSEYADPCDVGIEKPIICKVRTLYKFTSQSAEELSFEKDIVLEIVDKPKDDPDWWQARMSNGEIGLVPRNYVDEIVSSVTPGASKSISSSVSSLGSQPSPTLEGNFHEFSDRAWYHGSLSRQECESILNSQAKHGEFLIRNSESKPGDYSLSMVVPDQTKHFKIMHRDNEYVIGQRSFSSVDELVRHYCSAPIHTTSNGTKVFLTRPVAKSKK